MRPLTIFTGIMTVFVVQGSALAAQTTVIQSEEEHEKRCITHMKLTQQQLESGLFQYEIDRCVQFYITRSGSSQRLERLSNRQQRFHEMRRERKRTLSKENMLRFRVIRSPNSNARTARASSRRSIKKAAMQEERGGLTASQARKSRALIRRERAKTAREFCKDIEKSFYPNCVREKLRSLGNE